MDKPQDAAAEQARPYTTPSAQSLAHEHGVDLRNVRGTGKGGRISKEDVLEAAKPPQQQSVSATASASDGFTQQNALTAGVIAALGPGMTSLLMQNVGERITEGVVTRWLKKEGDHVKLDELLLEISVHRDDVDEIVEVGYSSPSTGFLRKIIAAVGETVPIGGVLGVIGPRWGLTLDAPKAAFTAVAECYRS